MSTPPDADADAANDRALAGYDLHAWQTPPPAAGLADAVVARMQQTSAPARIAARSSARTIVAAAVATLVAAAAIAVVVVTHTGGEPARDDLTAQVDPPPSSPAPPSAPLPAGNPSPESERVRLLEERVAELEARLAELEAERSDPKRHVDPFKTPRTPPSAPEPAPVPPVHHVTNPFDPLDPYSPRDSHASAGSDAGDELVDPFNAKTCDAPTLVRQGKGALASGAYPAASTLFEAALRCDASDPWTLKLAYMAACETGDSTLATDHYRHLRATDQNTLLQLCVRYGIDPRPTPLPLPTAPPTAGHGKLAIASKPAAKVLVDGQDTGKTTPATLELPAGSHKVTFQVGGDRYTFHLTIKSGETYELNKDLQ